MPDYIATANELIDGQTVAGQIRIVGVDNVTVQNCAANSIYIKDSVGSRVYSNVFDAQGVEGRNCITGNNVDDLIIDNNQFLNAGNDVMIVQGYRNLMVVNNVFKDNFIPAGSTHHPDFCQLRPVAPLGADGLEFHNNEFDNTNGKAFGKGSQGLFLSDSSLGNEFKRSNISNNLFRDCGLSRVASLMGVQGKFEYNTVEGTLFLEEKNGYSDNSQLTLYSNTYDNLLVEAPGDQPIFGTWKVGFGKDTTGGEGGPVITVSTEQELISALSSPRPVVIEVDGAVQVSAQVNINVGDVTLRGAPVDGLNGVSWGRIFGHQIRVDAPNVLFEHIAVEGTDLAGPQPGDNLHSLVVVAPADRFYAHRCRFSFGVDETVSVHRNATNGTFDKCSFVWPLRNSVHSEGAHAKNLLIEGPNNLDLPDRWTVHRCLLAGADARNPKMEGTNLEIVNSLCMGGHDHKFHCVLLDDSNSPTTAAVYGTVMEPSPYTINSTEPGIKVGVNNTVWLNDNDTGAAATHRGGGNVNLGLAPWATISSPLSSSETREAVLSDFETYGDGVTREAVARIRAGTIGYIDSHTELESFQSPPLQEDNVATLDELFTAEEQSKINDMIAAWVSANLPPVTDTVRTDEEIVQAVVNKLTQV